MKLDTKKPLIVLVGSWNAAIFQPAWVAKHLYAFDDGVKFELRILHNPIENKSLQYINNIGYSVSPIRFEIYSLSHSDKDINDACNVANNLLSTLPHTPVGDFGINFHFIENDPDQDVYDKLQTNDEISIRYEVIQQELTSKIKYSNDIELNFNRTAIRGGAIIFDFNFNHLIKFPDNRNKLNLLHIKSLRDYSLLIIKNLYEIEGYQEDQFDFTTDEEAGENG